MRSEPPQQLLHYRLTEFLGRGGMAEVWKAHDERLDRDVAVKLLPVAWVEDPSEVSRLRREAQALAALSHPGIVAVHAVEDEGPRPFLVMEYVEGRQLSQLIPETGLPAHELVEYGLAVAGSLAAAHERGVTHGDLKPENVMVTAEGRVKVMDFGLAIRERSEPEGPEAVTRPARGSGESPGVVTGTPAYMAPEQLRGDPLTPAGDVFALGVTLYFMAVGERPFHGRTPAETVAAVLRDDPETPSNRRSGLPMQLDDIVLRCLEKVPAHRYPDARGVRDALASLRQSLEHAAIQAAAQRGRPDPSELAAANAGDSLVVVPFLDLSPARDQGYFCQGIAEDIATDLGKIPSLRVMAASRLDRSVIDPVAMGRMLGASTVLDGSVRRVDSQIRVIVRLVRVATGEQIWAERFDRTDAQVFEIQDAIASSVARAFHLLHAPAPRAGAVPSPEAYAAYLRGRFFWGKRYEGGLTRALDCFGEALAIDPEMAQAHAGRADCFAILAHYGLLPPKDGYAAARREVEIALELAPTLAEAHATRAWILGVAERRWQEAEEAYQRALELDPKYATGWEWYGLHLLSRGRPEQGIEALQQAQRLDPLSLMIGTMLGYGYLSLRDYDRGERVLLDVLETEPRFVFAHNVLGLLYLQVARTPEGVAMLERGVAISQREALSLAFLGYGYGVAGRTADAEAILAEFEQRRAERYVSPYHFALPLLGLGRLEESAAQFAAGVAEGDSFLASTYFAPIFDGLDEVPQFQHTLAELHVQRS